MLHLLRRSVCLVSILVAASFVAPAAASVVVPANDSYADPTIIPAIGGSIDTNIAGATREGDESSDHGVDSDWHWSVWYAWTAPASGPVRVDVCGADVDHEPWIDSRIGVLPAAGGKNATPIAASDAGCPARAGGSGDPIALVDFTATAGTEYRIALGSTSTASGSMQLRLTTRPLLETAPKLSGSAAVGVTLTATAPTWLTLAGGTVAAPTWLSCTAPDTACAPIAGATTSNYTVSAADQGRYLAVEFVAANALGATTTRSTAVAVLKPAAPIIPINDQDTNGNGVPDMLEQALASMTNAINTTLQQAMCAQFGICTNDPLQKPLIGKLTDLNPIKHDGKKPIEKGTKQDDLILMQQDVTTDTAKLATCNGLTGNDACVGSSKPDACTAGAGSDFCFGNKGNDSCTSTTGSDVCFGGAGNDTCIAKSMAGPNDKPKGALVPKTICVGGAGNDTCSATVDTYKNVDKFLPKDSQKLVCAGGAGKDVCKVAPRAPGGSTAQPMITECAGGAGNDLCVAKAPFATVTGVAATNAKIICSGGAGADTMWTLNGKPGDVIKGGGQKGDVCVADIGDKVTGCGKVIQMSGTFANPKDDEAKSEEARLLIDRQDQTDEYMRQMLEMIRQIREQLAAIQQEQGDIMRTIVKV